MACKIELEEDIQLLKQLFPVEHAVFQILAATIHGLTMKFIPKNDEPIIINSIIMQNNSSLWFTESPVLEKFVEEHNLNKEPSDILDQVHQLLSELCKVCSTDRPVEMNELKSEDSDDDGFIYVDSSDNSDFSDGSDSQFSECDDGEVELYRPTEDEDESTTPLFRSIMKKPNQELKEKVEYNNAKERIRAEAEEIRNSECAQTGALSLTVNGLEWVLKFYKDSIVFTDDSELSSEEYDRPYLLLKLNFNECEYPAEAPWFTLQGNDEFKKERALCQKILRKLVSSDEWTPDYTMPAICYHLSESIRRLARIRHRVPDEEEEPNQTFFEYLQDGALMILGSVVHNDRLLAFLYTIGFIQIIYALYAMLPN